MMKISGLKYLRQEDFQDLLKAARERREKRNKLVQKILAKPKKK